MRNLITEGLELVGEGGEGKVYRLNENQVLKVYKRASLDTVDYWFRTTNAAIKYGIPSAKAYELVEAEGKYAVIFDYLKAQSVGRTISGSPERLEEYAEKMGFFLKKLHSTEDVDDLLENEDKRMFSWYEEGCRKNIFPDDVADSINTILTSMPNRITLLHGDFHEGNVVVGDNELMCVDLDRVGSGHPIYDLIGIHMNHDMVIKSMPDFFEKSWGLTVEQAFYVKDRMLKTYFGTDSDKLLKEYEAIIGNAFLMKRMLLPVTETMDMDDDAARAYVQRVAPEFMKIANELPDMIAGLPL